LRVILWTFFTGIRFHHSNLTNQSPLVFWGGQIRES
jgi:hypothetical protein